jgi:hypothetical protein
MDSSEAKDRVGVCCLSLSIGALGATFALRNHGRDFDWARRGVGLLSPFIPDTISSGPSPNISVMKSKVERETKEYQAVILNRFRRYTRSSRHRSRVQHLESTELFTYFAFSGAIVGSRPGKRWIVYFMAASCVSMRPLYRIRSVLNKLTMHSLLIDGKAKSCETPLCRVLVRFSNHALLRL